MQEKAAAVRNLLRQRIAAVCEEVIQNGGQSRPEDLQELQRLQELSDTAEATLSTRRPSHWTPLLALVCTLVISSVLFFVHLPEAHVDLDLAVSELAFTLDTPEMQQLTPGMLLTAVGIQGLQRLDLSELSDAGTNGGSGASQNRDIRMSVEMAHPGSITLAAIVLPAGTRVRVRALESAQRYRLTLELPKGSSFRIRVDLRGDVDIGLPGTAPQHLQLHAPAPVEMATGGGLVELDLSFPPSSVIKIASQLDIRDLSFAQIGTLPSSGRTIVRYLSTIQSGALYIESLNGEKRTLREAEGLRFEKSQGEIRKIDLRAGKVLVQCHARVAGMTSGSGDLPAMIMPTLLEWLRARHGLYLFWGTSVYLFGLLGSSLRWLKVLP